MHRFVVVEGLIGVGKTTLCRLLNRKRQATMILEPHEDNPFLASFYENPARYALPVQMYYLLTRWRQQERIRQLSMFEPWVVSDYLFVKDRIFAEKTLNDEELHLYDQFAENLGRSVPTPDLVIALDAPTEVLMARGSRGAACRAKTASHGLCERSTGALPRPVEPLDGLSGAAHRQRELGLREQRRGAGRSLAANGCGARGSC